MFSSLPSMTYRTMLPARSLPSASRCTVHFGGSKVATLIGMPFAPGLTVPAITVPSTLISTTTCSLFGPHSPIQVPLRGCPNWADAGAASMRSAATAVRKRKRRIKNPFPVAPDLRPGGPGGEGAALHESVKPAHCTPGPSTLDRRRQSAYRHRMRFTVLAMLLAAASGCASLPGAGSSEGGVVTVADSAQLLSIDHYVAVRSTAPSMNGQTAQLYVRERVEGRTLLHGSSGVVLFV